MKTRLSVVVIAYNMARELPRTVRSLSPEMQRGICRDDYELIVVDNGSTRRCDEGSCPTFGARTKWLMARDPRPSPAGAINQGIRAADGDLIGVMIDGARMASPGLCANALLAARLSARPVIASLAFHLGPETQMTSVAKGYDQEVEDLMLRKSRWEEDGYRLFDISVFAGASSGGWFAPIGESNALFLSRPLWDELGGYDERFVQPGGGLVNQDTFKRACQLPETVKVVLLGEGTFHQFHDGAATNALVSPYDAFQDEYARLRGEPYTPIATDSIFVGRVRPQTLESIARSTRPGGTGSRSWVRQLVDSTYASPVLRKLLAWSKSWSRGVVPEAATRDINS